MPETDKLIQAKNEALAEAQQIIENVHKGRHVNSDVLDMVRLTQKGDIFEPVSHDLEVSSVDLGEELNMGIRVVVKPRLVKGHQARIIIDKRQVALTTPSHILEGILEERRSFERTRLTQKIAGYGMTSYIDEQHIKKLEAKNAEQSDNEQLHEEAGEK